MPALLSSVGPTEMPEFVGKEENEKEDGDIDVGWPMEIPRSHDPAIPIEEAR